MGEPQHLSIGEVLSLVQRDFPDVTISKIRFLESQGLLDPERTPSGYRKFYATDIERLQWILTQQRDNFLPLRVIRERLDEWDATGVSPAGSGSDDPIRYPEPADDPSGTVEGDQVEPSTHGQDPGGEDPAGEPGSDAPVGPDAAPAAPETLDLRSAAEALAAASADEVAAIRAEREARERAARERAAEDAASRERAEVVAPAAGGGAHPVADPQDPGVPVEEFRVGPLDTAMTAEELAERAGVTVAVVKELENFSMISSHRVGPEHYYEPDSLRVVEAVAPFLERGIEVRHLRMYKIAAEREAGVFEQLVMPLLKQRNPEARARAVSQVQALSEAGERLHAALLRQALEQTLP